MLVVAPARAHQAHGDGAGVHPAPVVRAPGYAPLSFPAPEPGTYALPVLREAGDGSVLTSSGETRRLYDLIGGKVSVLSFVYTSCSDVDGCPLATFVLGSLQQRIIDSVRLRDRVRLLTLSFDPERDTPARMRQYGEKVGRPQSQWLFLTTASRADIDAILAAYDQSVVAAYDAEGKATGTFSHILRVILIDAERRVRNIYSTSFLHADTLVSDIETLLMEQERGGRAELHGHSDQSGEAGGSDEAGEAAAAGTGSSASARDRYASPEPIAADGSPSALAERARRPLLGLPALRSTNGVAPTPARIALGRKLFFDRRLSRNETISCAMCHVPEQGFTSNEMTTAVGIEGHSLKRNSPTLLNVAYASPLFHDGREPTLELQIWGPLLSPIEMANDDVEAVVRKVDALCDYAGLFEAAFDGEGATKETIGAAIASYERTLLAADSPFDRWRFGGEPTAMSDAARRGFALFSGEAGCVQCHSVDSDHALFTDNAFHDTGIGYLQAHKAAAATTRVRLAPGVYVDVDREIVEAASETALSDAGRAEATGDPADRWKYRTPTLRNVALTAPYMHDGSISTLVDVVEYYNGGGAAHGRLDPAIRRLDLDARAKGDLVAFLESLTGTGVSELVADAASAPIGDP